MLKPRVPKFHHVQSIHPYMSVHTSLPSVRSSELGIPIEIRYFRTTSGTFRYRNIGYNIGTDTDTERMIPNDFSGISEFPAPTKNLHNIHICPIGASVTILSIHCKCCLCRLKMAINCWIARSFCLHFVHCRIDPSKTGNTEQGTPSTKHQTQGSSSKKKAGIR